MGTAEASTRPAHAPGVSDLEVVPNLVGGAWVHPRNVELFDVYNPATGAVIARTPLSGAADVDARGDRGRTRLPRLARDAGRAFAPASSCTSTRSSSGTSTSWCGS